MNKTVRGISLSVLGAAVLPLLMSAPAKPTGKQRSSFGGINYAHRGLHSKDRSIPENSLAAFSLASERGYGIELDVQLSKDGQVVVFHDDDLKRVCGVDSRVDAFTFDELQELRLCGTDERIPLFTDVLKTVGGRSKLIVELKMGPRNRELCEKTLAILRGYEGEYCIESFHPLIVAWFRFHAPDILRGQLVSQYDDFTQFMPGFAAYILSRTFMNFICRPNFIAFSIGKRPLPVRLAYRLGAMDICWTSRDTADQTGHDSVIFEHYMPPARIGS